MQGEDVGHVGAGVVDVQAEHADPVQQEVHDVHHLRADVVERNRKLTAALRALQKKKKKQIK